METAEKIMGQIGEHRKREHYKQKYLNARGWCFVLIGAILFMLGVCLYAIYSVSELRRELSGRPPIIMPNGDTK